MMPPIKSFTACEAAVSCPIASSLDLPVGPGSGGNRLCAPLFPQLPLLTEQEAEWPAGSVPLFNVYLFAL